MKAALLLFALPFLGACAAVVGGEARAGDGVRAAIEAVLDDFHAAASEADGERYFAHFAAGAVFYGTDATERWDVAAFRAFCEPYFSRGTGWTYEATERAVFLGAGGETAWFDERVRNAKYGELRGTGVLVWEGGRWRIAQYNLAFPVPNELAPDLVERVAAFAAESTSASER